MNLTKYDIVSPEIFYNPTPALLYEHAILFDKGSCLTKSGALVSFSGEKTGRCPEDKRIVQEPSTEKDIDWGKVNIPLTRESFIENKRIATNYLNSRARLYVVDAFAGWDPKIVLKSASFARVLITLFL